MSTKTACPLEGQNIDYKNVELLKKYVTKFGKITPRYYTGVSLKNQKNVRQLNSEESLLGCSGCYDNETLM